MKLEEQRRTHKLLYECFFMKLFEDEVLLPNGKISTRIYVEHDGAAAILPITKEGKIVLLKQYRYPVKQVLIEIPAGKKDDPNESGLECAKRELEEETGYVSSNYRHLCDVHNCVGYSSEKIEVFLAVDCVKTPTPKAADDDEFLEELILSREEVQVLLETNQITNATTLIALQKYFLETTK